MTAWAILAISPSVRSLPSAGPANRRTETAPDGSIQISSAVITSSAPNGSHANVHWPATQRNSPCTRPSGSVSVRTIPPRASTYWTTQSVPLCGGLSVWAMAAEDAASTVALTTPITAMWRAKRFIERSIPNGGNWCSKSAGRR